MKLQSIVVALLRAGVPETIAWTIHGLVALAALGIAFRLWRLPGDAAPEARAVATMAAAFLATPYVLAYDAVALGMAGVFLARAAMRQGTRPGEQLLVVLAVALPLLLLFSTVYLAVPIGWIVMSGLALRRGFGIAAPVARP